MLILIHTPIIGLCAAIITEILMQPNMLLWRYWELLDSFRNNCDGKTPWWIKPLGYCALCLGGQFGFWLYFYFTLDYNIMTHVVFTLLTIFFTKKAIPLCQ